MRLHFRGTFERFFAVLTFEVVDTDVETKVFLDIILSVEAIAAQLTLVDLCSSVYAVMLFHGIRWRKHFLTDVAFDIMSLHMSLEVVRWWEALAAGAACGATDIPL